MLSRYMNSSVYRADGEFSYGNIMLVIYKKNDINNFTNIRLLQ